MARIPRPGPNGTSRSDKMEHSISTQTECEKMVNIFYAGKQKREFATECARHIDCLYGSLKPAKRFGKAIDDGELIAFMEANARTFGMVEKV